MPNLSTSPFQPALDADRAEKFVPFKAEIRVVPDVGFGRRIEAWRSLEKLALSIEDNLKSSVDFNDGGLVEEVAFSPQFGQFWAKVTIIGFWELSPSSGAPTTNVNLIHSGTAPKEKTALQSGNRGGDLSWGQDPTAATDTAVVTLIAALQSAVSGIDIKLIDFNGIIYGAKASRGFRSFPK